MGSYSGRPDNPERTKAALAVGLVHVGLAAIILSGLNVHSIRTAAETLSTFDVLAPPPPPPPPPRKPAAKPQKPRLAQGAAAKQARPTQVVAPKPKLPSPSPIVAAPVAGQGIARSSGAALAGTGTGAGARGNGPGGGGTGDTSGFSPARLVRNLNRNDYAALASGRMPVGSANVAIVIAPNGRIDSCRLLSSSGDRQIDFRLCPVLVERLRFQPARDASGQPIYYRTNYHARWRLAF